MSAPSDSLVLIVDDDGPIVESVTDVLLSGGYQVMSARDGATALSLLGGERLPDVILLDLMMPTMDGFEFRRRQLLDRRLAGIPTIVMTAGGSGPVGDLGAVGWLRKPMRVEELLATVAATLMHKPVGESPKRELS